ncbi:MFS transporter [Belnapia sp. T6]|uniref:MFS transporter n=1 Tax=Belnapia mucosa TaxID=2804532 RepID=A0ABS1V0X5_9PROT|nr:MFS transporter [Belnapia mucosa]MBL6455357.1 MFS transporter [Belnapia mucosa]
MPLAVQSRFALVYAAQFATVGVLVPFIPAVLAGHGLTPGEIATILALGSAVRLLAAPAVGRGADGWGDARSILVLASGLAACTITGFAWAPGFGALVAVAMLHALVSAPVVPLSDALCLGGARQLGFDYGRARSAGSASYIAAAVLAGFAVQWAGAPVVVWLASLFFLLTALAARGVPRLEAPAAGRGGFRAPFRDPAFRWLLPLSALIQGSHALYYGFATLHWQAAGLSSGVIGLLWGEGVVVEVALFLWGRPLVERLGPAGLAGLAALAGVVRWSVTAMTSWLPALVVVQLLHALTFGAMHLGAMRVLGSLPPGQAATAQTLHSSLGVGLAMGLLTYGCGPLYARFGGEGFWAMAALCAIALPIAGNLRRALRRRRG